MLFFIICSILLLIQITRIISSLSFVNYRDYVPNEGSKLADRILNSKESHGHGVITLKRPMDWDKLSSDNFNYERMNTVPRDQDFNINEIRAKRLHSEAGDHSESRRHAYKLEARFYETARHVQTEPSTLNYQHLPYSWVYDGHNSHDQLKIFKARSSWHLEKQALRLQETPKAGLLQYKGISHGQPELPLLTTPSTSLSHKQEPDGLHTLQLLPIIDDKEKPAGITSVSDMDSLLSLSLKPCSSIANAKLEHIRQKQIETHQPWLAHPDKVSTSNVAHGLNLDLNMSIGSASA